MQSDALRLAIGIHITCIIYGALYTIYLLLLNTVQGFGVNGGFRGEDAGSTRLGVGGVRLDAGLGIGGLTRSLQGAGPLGTALGGQAGGSNQKFTAVSSPHIT